MWLRHFTDKAALGALLALAVAVSGCASTGPAQDAPERGGAGQAAARPGAAEVPPEALTMYEQAAAVMASGDFLDAELRFKEFLLQYPGYPGAHVNLAIIHLNNNNEDAARQVPHIRDLLAREGVDVPLVGDFHFNGHKLLTRFPECAEALAKYRINPGNVGRGSKRDSQYGAMIEVACRHDKPIRIGVNWGSLDQELLTRLMDRNSELPTPREARAIVQRGSGAPAGTWRRPDRPLLQDERSAGPY